MIKILKFNEEKENSEIFDYIKQCFLDISDKLGIAVDNGYDSEDEDGVMYYYDKVSNKYTVSIDKLEEYREGKSILFEEFYNASINKFESIQEIKDSIDKVKVKYPNCIVNINSHEYYEIIFDIK